MLRRVTQHRVGYLPFLVLGLLILIRWYPMLFGNVLFFGDNYSLMVPGKLYTASWLREGVLPLWNTTMFGGIPWLGDISQSILYPSTLLFVLFSPGPALSMTVILHTFLTGFGMYLLARKYTDTFHALVASMLWMFSLQYTGAVNNLATMQGLAWMPLVVHGYIQLVRQPRWILYTALCLLLQIMAGYPQYVMYSVGAGIILSFFIARSEGIGRQAIKRLMLATIVGVGLSAIVTLPFIYTYLDSSRLAQNAEQARLGTLRPTELLKMVIPYVFDMPTEGMKWGPGWNSTPNPSMYGTWVGMLAIVISFRRRIPSDLRLWIGMVGVSILLALAPGIPVIGMIIQLLPGVSSVRGSSLILSLANMGLILWIVRSLPLISRLQGKEKLKYAALAVTLIMLIMFLLLPRVFPHLWHALDGVLQGRISTSSFHTVQRDAVITRIVVQSLLVSSAATFFFFLWYPRYKNLAFLVLALEMAYCSRGLIFWGPPALYPTWTEIHAKTQYEPGQPRVLFRNENAPYTGFGSYWEALMVRSPFSDSFVTPQERSSTRILRSLSAGLTPDWNGVYRVDALNGYTTLLPSDVSQRFSQDGVAQINKAAEIDPYGEVSRNWSVGSYRVDTWFPHEQEPPNVHLINATEKIYTYAVAGLARYRTPDGIDLHPTFTRYTPNTIEFSVVNTDGAPAIVIADRYDPGWTATVNGRTVPIQPNEGMRMIPLEPGTNEIMMRYTPKGMSLGALITLATGILAYDVFVMRMKLFSPNSK